MASTQIMRDLAAQTESYLSESLEDAITATDRERLVTWLCSKIEEERQGWKKKIQMSFNEVEKERKLALSVHSTVQQLNAKFVDYQEMFTWFQEDRSLYQGSDTDSRISNIELLEQNIEALLQVANQMYHERMECFQFLKVADNNCHLADVIKHEMNRFDHEIKDHNLDNQETENRHLREIQNLNETLDMQIKLNQELSEKLKKQVELNQVQNNQHGKEILEMRKIIVSLRNKVPDKVKTDTSVSMKKLIPTSLNKECQVNLKKPSRECCIQVSINVNQYSDITSDEPLSNNHKNLPKLHRENPINKNNHDRSTKSIPIHKQGNKSEIEDRVSRSNSVLSVNSDSNTKKNSSRKVDTNKHELYNHSDKPKRIKLKKLLSNDQSGDNSKVVAEYLGDETERNKENIDSVNEVKADYLRGQVVSLARKLDSAKVQMDKYQHQLALMKINNNPASSVNENFTPRSKYSSQSFHDFRPDKGFLSGVKVKEVKMSAQDPDSQSMKLVQRPSKSLLAYSGKAKCLRCNSLYKFKENHKYACRYHPKNKHRIEKYDTNGRLQRIFHLWQCCMQDSDSVGCTAGEHI